MAELLAPVGDWSMLTAAINAGADAVYFGIQGLNMRAGASNFQLKEVKKLVNFCHKHKVKAYCTVNVIVFEKELKQLERVLLALKKAQIDAVICWDLSVVKKCKELKIPVHLSTQASVSNSEAAKFWKKLGAERIVLARECSLEDLKEIKNKAKIETEIFVHGARCISLSGRCFMSYDLFGKSANRGECLQMCRREYKVVDEENKEMILENNFVMSAKDLCALPLLPKILSQGVASLKIEGRNRGAEYVSAVVSAYREALDAIMSKKLDEELIDRLMIKLNSVFNKDFSRGYLVEYPHHERTNVYGSKATREKVQLGKVANFYPQKWVVEFLLETGEVKKGDKIGFTGPTTGYLEIQVEEIHTDSGIKEKVVKGETICVKVPSKVRKNDKVFLLKKRA